MFVSWLRKEKSLYLSRKKIKWEFTNSREDFFVCLYFDAWQRKMASSIIWLST